MAKLGSFIDAYASACNCGFQTLKLLSMSLWIVHAFIHACWCSSVTSSHLRETLPYLMSSWHHHTILYHHLIVLAQWWRWPHCSRLLDYDCCILPFVNVVAKKCIEHVSDKEDEGMEDDRGSYGALMYGSTLTTLNVLITLWTLICVSNSSCTFIFVQKLQFLLFPQCLHQVISQTYMNSRNII